MTFDPAVDFSDGPGPLRAAMFTTTKTDRLLWPSRVRHREEGSLDTIEWFLENTKRRLKFDAVDRYVWAPFSLKMLQVMKNYTRVVDPFMDINGTAFWSTVAVTDAASEVTRDAGALPNVPDACMERLLTHLDQVNVTAQSDLVTRYLHQFEESKRAQQGTQILSNVLKEVTSGISCLSWWHDTGRGIVTNDRIWKILPLDFEQRNKNGHTLAFQWQAASALWNLHNLHKRNDLDNSRSLTDHLIGGNPFSLAVKTELRLLIPSDKDVEGRLPIDAARELYDRWNAAASLCSY